MPYTRLRDNKNLTAVKQKRLSEYYPYPKIGLYPDYGVTPWGSSDTYSIKVKIKKEPMKKPKKKVRRK